MPFGDESFLIGFLCLVRWLGLEDWLDRQVAKHGPDKLGSYLAYAFFAVLALVCIVVPACLIGFGVLLGWWIYG